MKKEYFETLTDSRQQAKVLHNFTEIVMMVICAVIAGCDVWEDIADYCRVKEGWLRERIGLKLENGIPSHDTLSRVFSMLDPTEFQGKFIEWAQAACGNHSREILSFDGKTMRGSRDGEEKPVHMVSAWASKAKAVFGQLAVDEKSNEITAVPALLELLDIKGLYHNSGRNELPEGNRSKDSRRRSRLHDRPERESTDTLPCSAGTL